MKYPHLAARVFNTPLLIHPQKLDAIIAGLGTRLLGSDLELLPSTAHSTVPAEMFSTRGGTRGDAGYTVVDGVAVISASGGLVHRTRMDTASSYLLGYNTLAMQLEAAMADPEVHAVLQIWDSPGGEVSGAFEYAQRISDLRGKKPMWAIADSMAASAAYLGGSAFEQLAVSSTGYVGSIGVVMRHVDFSQAMSKDGITVTHIYAGDHKIDGNPYQPLPKDVQAGFQSEIDSLYALFVDAVAAQRGLSAEHVRSTQAQVYRGMAAVSMGLADRVATTDQLLSEMAALRARSYPTGLTALSNTPTTTALTGENMAEPTSTAPAVSSFTQTDIDTARAQGQQEGASAERTRASAILGHAGAASNMALAVTCVQSGLSVEQAEAILGAAPKQSTKPSANNEFAAAMASLGNPQVSGLEASGGQGGTDDASLAASIVGLIAKN